MDLSILTLLKTLRLARLARLIRALRYPIFRTFGLSWIQSNSIGGGFKDGFFLALQDGLLVIKTELIHGLING